MAGFTSEGAVSWLPVGSDHTHHNVRDQRQDPLSILSLTRRLIGLRKTSPALQDGAYVEVAMPSDQMWAWCRGDDLVVILNLCDKPSPVLSEFSGSVVIDTLGGDDPRQVAEPFFLNPWQGLVIRREH